MVEERLLDLHLSAVLLLLPVVLLLGAHKLKQGSDWPFLFSAFTFHHIHACITLSINES